MFFFFFFLRYKNYSKVFYSVAYRETAAISEWSWEAGDVHAGTRYSDGSHWWKGAASDRTVIYSERAEELCSHQLHQRAAQQKECAEELHRHDEGMYISCEVSGCTEIHVCALHLCACACVRQSDILFLEQENNKHDEQKKGQFKDLEVSLAVWPIRTGIYVPFHSFKHYCFKWVFFFANVWSGLWLW